MGRKERYTMSNALAITDHSVSFPFSLDNERYAKLSKHKQEFIDEVSKEMQKDTPSLAKVVEIGEQFGYGKSASLKDTLKICFKGTKAKDRKVVVDSYMQGNHDAHAAMTTAFITDKLANGYTPDMIKELCSGKKIRIDLVSSLTPAQIRAQNAELEAERIQRETAEKFKAVKSVLDSLNLNDEQKAAFAAVIG